MCVCECVSSMLLSREATIIHGVYMCACSCVDLTSCVYMGACMCHRAVSVT